MGCSTLPGDSGFDRGSSITEREGPSWEGGAGVGREDGSSMEGRIAVGVGSLIVIDEAF